MLIFFSTEYSSFSRQQMRINNQRLLQENEEQFVIEEQIQQVQVSDTSFNFLSSNQSHLE